MCISGNCSTCRHNLEGPAPAKPLYVLKRKTSKIFVSHLPKTKEELFVFFSNERLDDYDVFEVVPRTIRVVSKLEIV